ncbi:5-formyltetrahydrofolate cyclo-ligase [Vibrio tapetis subsp. quintayensis]|uniref:5-formyltetrahydrofolate cyclo-ligase n=1 Tax=Vibrio tapetis TaxID=52443 RepID=UPI0025B33799|nr:5-formyltetrahydrofolate cyclo-ligase [Vibrio tapetis]MDN3681705.1 5-formyltetrahydrofolate cyclo-ligase [Vibrio tapetis subsp. quintayensis]
MQQTPLNSSTTQSQPEQHQLAYRKQLRQSIRTKRQALTSVQQQQASQQLLKQVSQLPALITAKNVAIYLAADGEIDPMPSIQWLWQHGYQVCLPVIHPFSKGQLLFLKYQPDTAMVLNRYQIQEPKLAACDIVPVNDIDIIFTPLVAFDAHGQRMGMGGGYYDRTLAPWLDHNPNAIAIGLAHDCQQVTKLTCETWDVPLPIILTPSHTWQWESKE